MNISSAANKAEATDEYGSGQPSLVHQQTMQLTPIELDESAENL